MQNLSRLSWSDKGPELAREYLEKAGIHLVIEPHLPKTYLDDAACVGTNDSPVIAFTLRHETGNHRLFGSAFREKVTMNKDCQELDGGYLR
jgi:hypothetical protein